AGEAAALAALRAREEDIERISRAARRARTAARREHANPAAATLRRRAEEDFRGAIIRGAHNRALAVLARAIDTALAQPDMPRSGHDGVVAAIREGQPHAARAAMREHVAATAANEVTA